MVVAQVLLELHASHRALQQQFKEVHKAVDKLRSAPTRPSEVRKHYNCPSWLAA